MKRLNDASFVTRSLLPAQVLSHSYCCFRGSLPSCRWQLALSMSARTLHDLLEIHDVIC